MFKEIFSRKIEQQPEPEVLDTKAEEFYQKELAPLFRVFKQENESQADCETRLLSELSQDAAHLQDLKGTLLSSPEQDLVDMKNLLVEKMRSTLEVYESKSYREIPSDEQDFIKKAKIVLVAVGDLSNLDKYKERSRTVNMGLSSLGSYLNASNRWGRSDDSRLRAEEVRTLLQSELAPALLSFESNYTVNEIIKEVPDELLQYYIKSNKKDLVDNAIDNQADPAGYSKETVDLLLANGHAFRILKHLNSFEKSLDETSIKKAIRCYGPSYPCHLSDLTTYINHANLSEDLKIELTDYIFKHESSSGTAYEGLCNNGYINVAAQEQKLDPIVDGIKEAIGVKGIWEATSPENLAPENLAKVKSYIELGYIGLFTQYNNAAYTKYLFETDYKWLMDTLVKNDQENLYFFTGNMEIDDRKKYLQKLADENRETELVEMVQKTGEPLISKAIYADLIAKGHAISPRSSYEVLDENIFVDVLKTSSNFLESRNLFDNIEKFNLGDNPELADYAAYKKIVDFVDGNFITVHNRHNLYEVLDLSIEKVKQIGFDNAQAEISAKANLLSEKLPLLYPNKSGSNLDDFHSEFGFESLKLTEDGLREILDLALSLPQSIVREYGLGKQCLGIAKPLTSEGRTEFLNHIDKMITFSGEVSSSSTFIQYYLNKSQGARFGVLNDFINVLPKYKTFYEALSDDDKKFFESVFPWSEATTVLDIEFEKSQVFSSMLSSKISISEINFEKAEDGKAVCKYLNHFGISDTPDLFLFVTSLIKSGNNLSPETIQALKDDFNIEIDLENYNQAETLSAMSNFFEKNVLKFVTPDELGLGQSDVVNAIRDLKMNVLDNRLPESESRLALNFLNKYCLDLEDQNILPVTGYILSKEQWQHNLLAYVCAAEETLHLNEIAKSTILNLFSGEYRDFCLENMSQEWQVYLNGQSSEIPLDLAILAEVIKDAGGAGNLKYIESFADLISAVNKSFGDTKTVDRTKTEVKNFLLSADEKITKDKLSQDDRAQFYTLTKDMIEAAPSLLASLEIVFDKASSKDVKTIFKELMPLYQLELIIVQKNDGSDNVSYDPRELVTVRKSLSTIADDLNSNPENSAEIFNSEKKRLGDFVKNGFKDRFGLIKIPVEFSKDNMRSIQNCLRYVANISGRNLERETLISFYLGLQLNGEWEKFRQGADINVEEYLSSDKASIIKSMLEGKKANQLPTDIANINPDKLDNFQEILQRDVVTNMVGSVETIDVKLGNINRNVQELLDPDAYESKKEKDIINLLSDNGRLVGAVLAKTYKNLPLNPDEVILQNKIAEVFDVSAWDGEAVKKIQDEISPFSLVTNMVNELVEEQVTGNIEELQKILAPSEDIINIFNSLDENFKTNSGALALSRDLEYLEELIIKNDSKLSVEDKAKVTTYIDSIRQQMKGLESSFQKVKEYFDKVKKSSHLISSEIMKDRLAEVEKIIYSTDNNAMIISQLTSNLDLIIENMRQCLGCVRKEANNDTNLAFGDYNKFFLMSQKEKGRGSIADEIIFFMPITDSSGRQEMSFVMDNIYGNKSSDILLAHVATVYKKYAALKKEDKEANISISVSGAALSSVGLNAETFQDKIKAKISELESVEYVPSISINIPKSSLSDNYIEFSSKDARGTGEAVFSAVILK